MKKRDRTLLLLLFLLGLGVYFFGAPTLRPHTILSADKLTIKPEGGIDENNNVYGTYWTFTMTTDCTDEAAVWIFNNDTDMDRHYQGETVEVASTVEIHIDPEPPYWTRPVEVHSHQVYPKTYGTWKSTLQQVGKITDSHVPSLSVNSYQFGSREEVPNAWAVHTPFYVTVKKNGLQIADPLYVDSVGMVETFTIENPSKPTEYVKIKNLGALGTRYGQPSITDIICIEKELMYVFSGSDEVENKINYDASNLAYSNYWFGGGSHYVSNDFRVERWGDDNSPAHYYYPPVAGVNLIEGDDFPGSYRDDTFWGDARVRPIAANVWVDKPSTSPYGRSLVNYLKQHHNTLDVDVWKCGAEITEDNFLRIDLPFASVNSLITVEVSSELADTQISIPVWEPQVSNVKFVSCTWENGETHVDINDRLFAELTVKQHSSVKSTATIKPTFATLDHPVAINPLAHSVDLKPDESTTVRFEVLNLGTTKQLSNEVTFIIENNQGEETDRESLTFTLQPKGVSSTILNVNTLDAVTQEEISGIPISVKYDSSSKDGYSISGTLVFDLEGVAGNVEVTAHETALYRGSQTTTTVKPREKNEVYFYLWPKGVTPPPSLPWDLILIAACAAIILFYVWRRRKKK